ncbi:MAG: hypothetical protein AAFX10_16440 [Pseudomonadota bacterium]
MTIRELLLTTIVATALLFLGDSAADEAFEDLEAPMTVFDTPGEVANAVDEMPRPASDPRGAAYNDAVPVEGEEIYDDTLLIGADRDTKAEIQAEYNRDLVDRVREGFVASPAFEGANQVDERLGAREDYFHIEEGEDVDLEDSFNDEAVVEMEAEVPE